MCYLICVAQENVSPFLVSSCSGETINGAKILNKMALEPSKTKKTPHLCDHRRNQPASYAIDLGLLNFNSLGCHNIANKKRLESCKRCTFFRFPNKRTIWHTNDQCAPCMNCYILECTSEYTITNLLIKGHKTSFINLMNVLGALVRSKGMTSNSYRQNIVLHAIFVSSPNFMRI